jgi:hypothetical protein
MKVQMRIVKSRLDALQEWKYRSLFYGQKASAGLRLASLKSRANGETNTDSASFIFQLDYIRFSSRL